MEKGPFFIFVIAKKENNKKTNKNVLTMFAWPPAALVDSQHSSVKGKQNTKMYEFFSNWRNLSSGTNPTRSLITYGTHRNLIGYEIDT